MFKKIVGLGFNTKWKNAKDVGKYIKSLVEGGATEFFTGYNPSYWHEKFGFEVSPNGRFAEHEQITDLETLRQIVIEAHKYDIEVFINLNAWYYTEHTFPLIKQMIEEFREVWVDGIICWNIGILEYLKEINYEGKINISTIMAVYNSEAIRFLLENYKINKVILSRELTLKEIEVLVTEFPDTLFEVFGEWDFCRYNNWLCFAEHKYWAKDICTVVLNDMNIKKKFRADFKEFILDDELSNEYKVDLMDDDYEDIFEQIEEIFRRVDLWYEEESVLKERLQKIIESSKTRVDLFFDSLKPIWDQRNKNIITYLKALKYLDNSEYSELEKEIEESIKTWIEYLTSKTKQLWGTAKLKAYDLANTYARWDNLNLYTYVFFSQFKNIDTVKFPTRWRNYNEKIQIITDVVENNKVDKKYLDRWVSIEKAHYDLTYLFKDKLWFRNMLKEFNIK